MSSCDCIPAPVFRQLPRTVCPVIFSLMRRLLLPSSWNLAPSDQLSPDDFLIWRCFCLGRYGGVSPSPQLGFGSSSLSRGTVWHWYDIDLLEMGHMGHRGCWLVFTACCPILGTLVADCSIHTVAHTKGTFALPAREAQLVVHSGAGPGSLQMS